MNATFWTYLDSLLLSSRLVIDRPKGSAHPRYAPLIYPLDYGYLDGTSAGDGDGIDVWRGSLTPAELDAIVCTVDLVKRDVEIKLVIGCTAEEKATILKFHNNSERMAAILIERESTSPMIAEHRQRP
jgi:inorganic pyrophosphatase